MKPNKQQKKQIRALIRNLPSMQHPDQKQKVTISGEKLIAGKILKLKNGSEVKADKRYLVEQNKDVNHCTEAEKVFMKGGIPAVEVYVKTVKEVYQKHLDKENSTEILKTE